MSEYLITPWHVETNAALLRRFGKLGEELGELQAVVCRCIIQGLEETDPSSGKTNRQRLTEELADVEAQMECTRVALGLDKNEIYKRVLKKIEGMIDWENSMDSAPF